MQAIIRAVCAIIDAFHFATEATADSETAEEPGADSSEVATLNATPEALADKDYAEDIQKALAKRVLPALQKQLVCFLGQLLSDTDLSCHTPTVVSSEGLMQCGGMLLQV